MKINSKCVLWSCFSMVFLMLIICCSSLCLAESAPEEEWTKTYGDELKYVFSLQPTLDEGYIVLGDSANGICLLKLDSDGNEQWVTILGKMDAYNRSGSVQQTKDNGYIVSGQAYSLDTDSSAACLTKLDAEGNIEWKNIFVSDKRTTANYVQQTEDGGYIFAGSALYVGSTPNEVKNNALIMKVDSHGTKKWERTFTGKYGASALSIQQTEDDGYIVVGTIGENKYYDALLIKTNSKGNEQWKKILEGQYWSGATSIQQTSDNGYIIAGITNSGGWGTPSGDALIVKTDSKGNIEWEKTYEDEYANSAFSIQQSLDNGYILCVFTNSFSSTNNGSTSKILKIDSNGNEQWNKTYSSTRDIVRSYYSSIQTSDGGYIFSGNDEDGNIFLVKLEGNESLVRSEESVSILSTK